MKKLVSLVLALAMLLSMTAASGDWFRTTYGGTTDVFKNIIAQHVLGLPRLRLPGDKQLVR